MNEEQKRIAIAEACGWKREMHTYRAGCWVSPEGKTSCRSTMALPDYFHDLNACHEMEKYAQSHLMNATQWSEYGRQLMLAHPTASISVPATDKEDLFYEIANIATCTAAQRAEAFGKTLGLWT